ncbi:MAG: hypothetical protein ACE5G2_08755 [Candidatus Krumholzibacteriia bacterium]
MSIDTAEELVRLLPNVSSCRIRTDERGEPVVVMVTAVPGSIREEVLADVITVLGAQARLDVVEDQVRVVVLDKQPSEISDVVLEELEHESRARLVSYNTRVTDERSLAEAEVAHGARVALGRAEVRGAGTSPELLASACLDAVEKLCHGRVTLRLAGFQRTAVGGEDVVCVLVQETEGRTERLHVGAARVAGDASRAGAYAALDSMNRRLGRILAGPPQDYEID